MTSKLRTEVFVLAGGRSSRMGRDKGMVSLNGKPMVSYVLETLNKLDLSIKIIANDAAYESFGFPVFPDVVKEKGPMGGLLTAFENTRAESVFLVSCDMPLIPEEAIKKLLERSEKNTIVTAQIEGRIHPLFTIYPISLKAEVKERISSGRLKMADFILENRHTLVPFDGGIQPQCFQNINTQNELKEVEEKWNNFK